jgi:hypothetical protein
MHLPPRAAEFVSHALTLKRGDTPMFDSFRLTESRTDNPDVPELVDDVVGPAASPAGSFDLIFPTQTAFPEVSGLKIEQDVIEFSPDQAVTWTAIAMAESGGQQTNVPLGDLVFESTGGGGRSTVLLPYIKL